MTQKPTNLESAARTDVGMVRRTNEDAFGCCPEAGIFAVCDGMGGAAAGEVASRIAVDTLIEQLCAVESLENRRKVLEEAIASANRMVHTRAEEDTALHGMGTTLVAVAIGGDHALIAHVGDSRCYLFRRGELIRQTNDHSLVDEQLRMGQITQDQAERSPLRSVITRAIGTQRSVSAEIAEVTLEPGDMLLLCSDGLTRELSDERIAAMLAEGESADTSNEKNINELCRKLVDAAKQAGGRDNVTCILTKVLSVDVIEG
jgi:PPM family protein phosphatase